MAVIEITLTESTLEVVSGIPKTISIEASIPSTIFYTFDGTDPTEDSDVYISALTLPTTNPTLVFKVYATNGTDSSVIVTETFGPSITELRHLHSLTADSVTPVRNASPFGDSGGSYSTAKRTGSFGGLTVDDHDVENIDDGYDGTLTGTFANGTDAPLSDYNIIYSERNRRGEYGVGIGTLPARTVVRVPPPQTPSSSSNMNDKLFNPKAMIIFQDSREAPYDPNLSQLNREFFSLSDIKKTRDGQNILNTAFEGNVITGSFLRSHYNPTDHTITYFYRDRESNRWIISKEAFTPKNENIGSLWKMVFNPREKSAAMIFSWTPFMKRHLT